MGEVGHGQIRSRGNSRAFNDSYACGGDGSGGSGPVVVVPPPPPPPPAPPPPPPPPPPPTVTSVGASDMLALFHFYPNGLASGNIFWSSFGDRQGRYRPITPALFGVTSNLPTDDYATLEKIAIGVDVASVSRLIMVAPRDVLVISPHTLLASSGPNGELIAPGAALLSTDPVMVADGMNAGVCASYSLMAIAAAVTISAAVPIRLLSRV